MPMEGPTPHAKAPRWAWWIATGFGSGCLKPAPGTWGSLAALLAWTIFAVRVPGQVLAWCIGHGVEDLRPATSLWLSFRDAQPPLYLACWSLEILFLLLPVLMTWMAVKASDHVVRETGMKDPAVIVADEWAGMWIALWPLRWHVALHHADPMNFALILLVPFLCFRLFDIWKPWPIRQIQILPGGQGVVVDDIVAGLYAMIPTMLLAQALT